MSPILRSIGTILDSLSDVERGQLKQTLGAKSHQPSDLAHALLDTDGVLQVVRHASEDALSALKSWVLQNGQWRNIARRSRLAAGVEELSRAGWVFETQYGPYQSYALMPWELMPALLPALWDIPWQQISTDAPTRTIGPSPIWTPLWHDLFQFLSYARQEPLLLTTQGDVYRRQKNKLEKLLWQRTSLIEGPAVDYLLMTLTRLFLLTSVEYPYRYEVSESDVEALFAKTPQALFQHLSEHVFDPGRTAWPELAWISLASLLEPNQSLDISAAVRWLASIGMETVRSPYLLNQSIGALILMDFWEMTGTEAGRLTASAYAALRGQFEQPAPAQSLIQPTGEILVPPDTSLAERWRLDALASRVKSDRVSTYRLDQASVKRGIEAGLTADTHVEALQELARNPVPDNVRVNLEDWYRAAGRHRIMEVTIVHSQRPEDSRDVETLLGSNALGRLSPQDVIIPADRIKDVMKRLEKAGTPILSEVLKPSEREDELSARHFPTDPRPSWSIHLPNPGREPEVSRESLRDLMVQAQRSGLPVRLTFQAQGETVPRTEAVIPVTLETRWIQVYVVSQRRYILVEWARILSAEPDA